MKNPTKQTIIDLLVIGGGPAGMTAAIYSARGGMKTVVVEKEAPGGKMIKTEYVENYPGYDSILGPDLAMKMYQQATGLGAEFVFNEVVDLRKNVSKQLFEVQMADQSILIAKAVVIATGTQENQLGIPGEQELYGKGVSYCAVCDGAFHKGKAVAVVGGGYSAVTESMYLTKMVKKLYVIVRKPYFRTDKASVERLQNRPGVEFLLDSVVTKVNGKDKVESISVTNIKTGKTFDLEVTALFPYIGATPATQMVRNLKIVNDEGYVSGFDAKLETKVTGLFVAGDVRDVSLRQIAIATGDGAIAGQMAVEYIQTLK